MGEITKSTIQIGNYAYTAYTSEGESKNKVPYAQIEINDIRAEGGDQIDVSIQLYPRSAFIAVEVWPSVPEIDPADAPTLNYSRKYDTAELRGSEGVALSVYLAALGYTLTGHQDTGS